MNDRERFAAAFGHLHASPDTLKEVQRRMNDTRRAPRRILRRGLGLAGRALRPKRHAAQPHEVGLGTQPPPSPHRAR